MHDLPAVGGSAPDFKLVTTDLADVTLGDYAGKKKLLNIVPSLDTDVCATSTRKFNESFAGRGDAVALVVSADLPFASGRFCSTEGLENVVPDPPTSSAARNCSEERARADGLELTPLAH